MDKIKPFFLGSDPIVKNLASELIQSCAQNNVFLKPEVAILAINLLSTNPDNGISLDSYMGRENIDIFLQKCLPKFLDDNCLLTKILELQVLNRERSIDTERIQNFHEDKLKYKSNILIQDILDFEASTTEEQNKLFKKVVIYIMATNKQGSPNNKKTVDETGNALQSVFSRADLVDFAGASKKRRMGILLQLQKLVCGIRLFNKDAGHCGEGIRDIVSDVTVGFKNTKATLTNSLSIASQNVSTISKVMKNIFSHEDNNQINEITELDDCKILKDILTLNCQYQYYVNDLLQTVAHYKLHIDEIFHKFRETLDALHEMVKYRIAVATEKVFPYFMTLSELWKILTTYLYTFVEINALNDDMRHIVESSPPNTQLMHNLHRGWETEKQAKSQDTENVNAGDSNVQVLERKSDMPLAPFSKFCAHLFISGDGLLIPTESHVEVVHYKNFYFTFSESSFLKLFCSDIEANFATFLKTVRRNPEMIIFFGLFHEIVHIKDHERANVAGPDTARTVKVNMDVQTEVHPIPYNKDKNYCWNVWDLRRKAIQLANIRKCETHSTQTDISYYRASSRLQAYEPKEHANQTMQCTSVQVEDTGEPMTEVTKFSSTDSSPKLYNIVSRKLNSK